MDLDFPLDFSDETNIRQSFRGRTRLLHSGVRNSGRFRATRGAHSGTWNKIKKQSRPPKSQLIRPTTCDHLLSLIPRWLHSGILLPARFPRTKLGRYWAFTWLCVGDGICLDNVTNQVWRQEKCSN